MDLLVFCHQEDYYWNSYSKDNNMNEYIDTEDIEDETIFHKNQEKQSAIWAVLTPIIILLGSFAMIIGSGVLAYNYGKAHPEFKTQLVKISDSYQDAAIKSNFTKIDLKKDSYSFYIEPEIWNKLSQSYKIKMTYAIIY